MKGTGSAAGRSYFDFSFYHTVCLSSQQLRGRQNQLYVKFLNLVHQSSESTSEPLWVNKHYSRLHVSTPHTQSRKLNTALWICVVLDNTAVQNQWRHTHCLWNNVHSLHFNLAERLNLYLQQVVNGELNIAANSKHEVLHKNNKWEPRIVKSTGKSKSPHAEFIAFSVKARAFV